MVGTWVGKTKIWQKDRSKGGLMPEIKIRYIDVNC